MNKEVKVHKFFLISLFVIFIDQLSKILVHNYMEMGTIGEIYVLGDWFRLHYLLNPGMAFGMEFDSEYGKFFLTSFRILASCGLGYAIYYMAKKKTHPGFLICLAMIMGGAIGNVIDSVFYGVLIENNAIPGSPTPWFHGQVIDMLYFPMVKGIYPTWFPMIGGKPFLFFSPVFNIADSAIFLGVVFIMIFQGKFAKHDEEMAKLASESEKKEGIH
ncbi:lipoprotein signal peptidase [Sediminitomix flava]|uniref:Lipoprotein signal peptidase n=1 Tax=Sediminitomix flava TaxID=379075 RepID=A0A315ZF49_SEDFL|nr:lipoprotein signal peptidase [Sediminitomix flava]PWJ43364.1 signal peptidase II [Sediminitomix flava]